MFGYIVVNKPELKFREFETYRSYYCGLCRQLKTHYKKAGQMTLSYDMTFVVMMLTSLYEPEETTTITRCVAHPMNKHRETISEITDYVAHMNVLLSVYQCRDDWQDDRKIKKLIMEKTLSRRCDFSMSFYREKWKIIHRLLGTLTKEEKKGNQEIDYMSGLFGKIMAEIFAYQPDMWEQPLRTFGFYLGKFVYLMDAYEDVEDDIKTGNYNPFKERYKTQGFDDECYQILTLMMAECSKIFEVLPLVDHIDILRNILYSGVWYRYEQVRKKREEKKGD